jgi:hypothetical protein
MATVLAGLDAAAVEALLAQLLLLKVNLRNAIAGQMGAQADDSAMDRRHG